MPCFVVSFKQFKNENISFVYPAVVRSQILLYSTKILLQNFVKKKKSTFDIKQNNCGIRALLNSFQVVYLFLSYINKLYQKGTTWVFASLSRTQSHLLVIYQLVTQSFVIFSIQNHYAEIV